MFHRSRVRSPSDPFTHGPSSPVLAQRDPCSPASITMLDGLEGNPLRSQALNVGSSLSFTLKTSGRSREESSLT